VTAWSIQETGGQKIYPGRDMRESHAHLNASQREFDVVATEIKASLYPAWRTRAGIRRVCGSHRKLSFHGRRRGERDGCAV